MEGFEPTTLALQVRCSGQLSYTGIEQTFSYSYSARLSWAHAWVRTFPGLSMNRRGAYPDFPPRLYVVVKTY